MIGCEIMDDDINEILKECARLRGIPCLVHRVLTDFSAFVNAIIHKEWEHKPYFEELKKYRYNEAGDDLIFQFNDPNALIGWAKLFREYYRDQAVEWREAEMENMRELFGESQESNNISNQYD
jgi:hypothetical protein